MQFKKTTEAESRYDHLEQMSTDELLRAMNQEDAGVHEAVKAVIPKVVHLVEVTWPKMKEGGRLFYLGAGTSGRLGIVDASECPPTFGVPHGMVVGLIAGGDGAIRKAVEFAEDDRHQAWKDLADFNPSYLDTVIGIAASGTTPYVIGGLEDARAAGLTTGCVTCNQGAPLAQAADHPIEVVVGPEFVTGSTRLKSGTAQKMVLNMISTGIMIRLGRVKGNRMVDMQLSNEKLVDRGTRMVMEQLGLGYEEANTLLQRHKSVRAAIESGGSL